MKILAILTILWFGSDKSTMFCEKAREMRCFSRNNECTFYMGEIC